jgi:predicted DNA-binding transcriptional regulator AlpA
MAHSINPSRATIAAVGLYLTRDELCRRWGISRATSYRYESDGYLPRPVRLGPGASRWLRAEIEAVERRAAEDRGGQP